MAKRFIPPPVNAENPELVEIDWIDAYGDNIHDGPVSDAGGLVCLPRTGYYVRYVPKGPHGPYVVLAAEWDTGSDGQLHVRDIISIPRDWIVRWSRVTSMEQVWPVSGVSNTTTSSTKPHRTKKAKSDPTSSSKETSAGVNPSASRSDPRSS